jgi:hypothetical protein
MGRIADCLEPADVEYVQRLLSIRGFGVRQGTEPILYRAGIDEASRAGTGEGLRSQGFPGATFDDDSALDFRLIIASVLASDPDGSTAAAAEATLEDGPEEKPGRGQSHKCPIFNILY